MQVVGDLLWVEWLEEYLDYVAEADDKHVKLVDCLRRKGVSRSFIQVLGVIVVIGTKEHARCVRRWLLVVTIIY